MLSWAREADRLAFVYYEDQKYDVYTINNPRGLKRAPYQQPAVDSVGILARVATPPLDTTRSLQVRDEVRVAGRRGRLDLPDPAGIPLVERPGPAPATRPSWRQPVSISALHGFGQLQPAGHQRVHARRTTGCTSTPDYIARPSIGYARDNFGRGFFGGSAISLSDILGNHQLVFAGYVNGRIAEAQVLAAYANLSKRVNWAVGI